MLRALSYNCPLGRNGTILGCVITLIRNAFAASALMLAIVVSRPALADTFTLTNNKGGDGSVTVFPGGFEVFGANNGAASNITLYQATASTDETFTAQWLYFTNDSRGFGLDIAGYMLNGTLTRLAGLSIDPLNGSFVLNLLAGDTYGIWVDTLDGLQGAGVIAVVASTSPSEIPLPAALPLFTTGLGALGLLGWRRKRKNAAATTAA